MNTSDVRLSSEERRALDRVANGIDAGTVIPLVGAGISHRAAGLPLWRTLLTDSMQWCHDNRRDLGVTSEDLDAVSKLLDFDAPSLACFEKWAKAVFCRSEDDEHWQHPLYGAWLESFFGDREIQDDRIYDALRAMEPRVIITTNYDRLLSEEVAPHGEVVTWGNPNTIRDLFREGHGVFYVHGTYDVPSSVILTSADYERVIHSDTRSSVASLMTSHSILLFVGVSPAGATDRHLASLLKLSRRAPSDSAVLPRSHVLLHRGRLLPKEVARLKSFDIQPVSFGEHHDDLAPFLERLAAKRADARRARLMLGLDQSPGRELRESRWHPAECLRRVEYKLRFMGWRGSKWVTDDETIDELDRVLRYLDTRGEALARFLILDPSAPAWKRMAEIRPSPPSAAHLEALVALERQHPSIAVRCVDFVSAFRFAAVDDREVGLGLYPTNPREHLATQQGWAATHFSLSAERDWTLGRSLLFLFDEHFARARPLDEALRDVSR